MECLHENTKIELTNKNILIGLTNLSYKESTEICSNCKTKIHNTNLEEKNNLEKQRLYNEYENNTLSTTHANTGFYK